MFRGVILLDALEQVADPAEWQEFSLLRPVNGTDCWVASFGGSSTSMSAYERNVLRYRELWAKFTHSLREKLISGEMIADGFSPVLGTRPVQIHPRLWRVLEFVIGEDQAEGGGYSFLNLAFSQAGPSDASVNLSARPHLLKELVKWIEVQARAAPGPMTAEEVMVGARRAFEGTRISKNLFGEAWRAADKPENFRQRGRPKAKVSGR